MRKSLILLMLVGACAADAASETEDKGVDDVVDLVRNLDDVDAADLLALGSPFATDAVNEQLTTEHAEVRLSDTTVYGLGDADVEDLRLLRAGIVERLGRSELTSQMVDLRTRYLESNPNGHRYFADTSFQLGGSFADSLGFDVPGLGEDLSLRTRVGFAARATLEARTVRAFASESAAYSAPLAAIRETRGFVLPRSVADLQTLVPGETIALSGWGKLGVNLGVSAPIFAADPAGGLTWSVAFSAAARAALEGQLDVQVAKLDGDQLVIDLGISDLRSYGFRVALEDRWGAAGLVADQVDLDVGPVDLAQIAERAFAKELDRRVGLSASLSREGERARLTVLRFRVDLARAERDPELEAAIAQLLRADARLAQLLATQERPGIVAEFQAHHSGVTRASYAGVDVLGLRFFQERIAREGEVTTNTEDGIETIVYDALEDGRGWFSAERRFARVGVGSLETRRDGTSAGAANLFLRLEERGAGISREAMLDNLGGALVAMVGPEPLDAAENLATMIQDAADDYCDTDDASRPSRRCYEELLQDPGLQDGIRRAQERFDEAAIADPATKALASELAANWIALHVVKSVGSLFGSESLYRHELRLDDQALAELMRTPGSALRVALVDYLAEAGMSRHRVFDDAAERAEDENRRALEDLERLWDARRAEYLRLLEAEQHTLTGQPLGDALFVRVPLREELLAYAELAVSSFPARRAQLAVELVDELVEEGERLDSTAIFDGVREEEAVSYALASLADRGHRTLSVGHRLGGSDFLDAAGMREVEGTLQGDEVDWIGDAVFSLESVFGH